MSNYKVGDHVVVEKSNIEYIETFAGFTGVIIGDNGSAEYPYLIQIDNRPLLQIYCKVKSLAPEYKIGDHVVCEKSNVPSWDYKGKTGVINRIDMSYQYPYRIKMDDGSEVSWCTVKCLVEEKKMFTATDLKTGMFGVTDKGEKFVIVNDLMIYDDGGYDIVSHVRDDMTIGLRHITKVYEGIKSFKMLEGNISRGSDRGTLVYEYEPEKPLYNGKVVCIDATNNPAIYTVGKIYQFKDGKLTGDTGRTYPTDRTKIHTFNDWADWTSSKFIEVKE